MLIAGRILGMAWSLSLLAFTLPGQSVMRMNADDGYQKATSPRTVASLFPFAKPQVILGSRYFSGPGTLSDVDMDGFMDVVFGGTMFFEQGGTFSFMTLDEDLRTKGNHRFHSPSKNPTHVFPHVVSADLNEDHMPDVIGVGYHGGIAIHLRKFIHKGNGTRDLVLEFQSRHYEPREIDPGRVGAMGFRTRVLRCLDVDSDGHDDLLLAGDFFGLAGIVGSSGLLLLRGNGRGDLARPVVLVHGRVISVEVLDHDEDGRMEFIVLGKSGLVTRLQPKLHGGYSAESWLLTAIENPEALYVRDVDQDGNVDFVLLASRPQKRSVELAVYPGLANGRPCEAWTWSPRMKPCVGPVASWILEDMNGDSYPDLGLLCVDPSGRMQLRLLAGEKEKPWTKHESLALGAHLASDPDLAGPSVLKFEDIDGDGARDLWISHVRATSSGTIGIVHLLNEKSATPSVLRMGTATATGRGVLPRISTTGDLPRLGNRRFALRLSDVPGDGAPYWLWISHVRMDVQILGMQVKVFPFRTLMARSQGAGERGGLVRVPFRIPKDKVLLGQSLFVQWVFPSKGAKNPLSLARSEALEIRFLPSLICSGH